MREIKKVERKSINVGVLSSAPMHKPEEGGSKKPISMAKLASIHEFGQPSRNIPKRSFIRLTFDSNRTKIDRFVQTQFNKVFGRKQTVDKSFRRIGEWYVGRTKKTFVDNDWPGLAASTLKAKTLRGKTAFRPLIETGQLRKSIAYEVKNS